MQAEVEDGEGARATLEPGQGKERERKERLPIVRAFGKKEYGHVLLVELQSTRYSRYLFLLLFLRPMWPCIDTRQNVWRGYSGRAGTLRFGEILVVERSTVSSRRMFQRISSQIRRLLVGSNGRWLERSAGASARGAVP